LQGLGGQMKEAPKEIYLQISDKEGYLQTIDENGGFDPEGVTWCVDNIHASDIKYIREDIYQKIFEKLWKMFDRFDKLFDKYTRLLDEKKD